MRQYSCFIVIRLFRHLRNNFIKILPEMVRFALPECTQKKTRQISKKEPPSLAIRKFSELKVSLTTTTTSLKEGSILPSSLSKVHISLAEKCLWFIVFAIVISVVIVPGISESGQKNSTYDITHHFHPNRNGTARFRRRFPHNFFAARYKKYWCKIQALRQHPKYYSINAVRVNCAILLRYQKHVRFFVTRSDTQRTLVHVFHFLREKVDVVLKRIANEII